MSPRSLSSEEETTHVGRVNVLMRRSFGNSLVAREHTHASPPVLSYLPVPASVSSLAVHPLFVSLSTVFPPDLLSGRSLCISAKEALDF